MHALQGGLGGGERVPCTLGTTEVNGPDETRIVTAEPFAARPDGVVPTTGPC